MPDQLTFDFGGVDIHPTNTSKEEKRLRKADVPAAFTGEMPIGGFHGHQDTLAYRMQAEELAKPDPLELRVPAAGDAVEVLWAKAWPHQGWATGTVSHIYPTDSFMSVLMHFHGKPWTCYVSRIDRARNPNIEKGSVWRWPAND